MAMGSGGGSYKGNSRGKPYGVMLLLAFGAALLGVMFIHKLREIRIFNLLVKEKDTQLISLHLLLQKEKEYTKEMKRKTEEMKAKIYSLRNQKMVTERRIIEMQSTIDSLKDERKIMESALEEKQNELKIRTETSFYPENENPQIIALMERLKQKQTEIDELKHRLENPVKIWSISTDDPSNTQLNSNVTGNLADGDETENGQLNESTNYSNFVNSARGNASDNASSTPIKGQDTARADDYGSENKIGIVDSLEVPREGRVKKPENSLEGLINNGVVGNETIDNGQGNKNEGSQENSASGSEEENKIANATEGIVSTVEKVTQMDNTDIKSADEEKNRVARDEQMGLENSQQEKGQDQENTTGGVKLEMQENARSSTSSSRVKEKHTKEKRWRILARNRRLESNRNYQNHEAEGMRKRKFSSNYQDEVREREDATFNKGKIHSIIVKGVNNPREATEAEDFSNVKLLEPQNPEDTVNLNNKPVSDDINHLEKFHGISKRVQLAQNRLELLNGSSDGNTSEMRSTDEKESLDEDEVDPHEVQHTSSIKEGRNMNMQKSAEQANGASKNERPEEKEAADIDHETDTANLDFYRESVSDLEEDKEEYNEENDEPEF